MRKELAAPKIFAPVYPQERGKPMPQVRRPDTKAGGIILYHRCLIACVAVSLWIL